MKPFVDALERAEKLMVELRAEIERQTQAAEYWRKEQVRAADALSEMRVENEQLRADLKGQRELYRHDMANSYNEISQARAINERLRTDEKVRSIDRVIAFLEHCGEADIEAGIGALLGIGSDEKIAAFKDGLARAIEQARRVTTAR